MVNNIQWTWKLTWMLRTYRIYNTPVRFSKYKFNNKLLSGVTLLIVTSGVTWTQLMYIYIYIYSSGKNTNLFCIIFLWPNTALPSAVALTLSSLTSRILISPIIMVWSLVSFSSAHLLVFNSWQNVWYNWPKWPNITVGLNIWRFTTILKIYVCTTLLELKFVKFEFAVRFLMKLELYKKLVAIFNGTWVPNYFVNSDRSSNISAKYGIWPFWPDTTSLFSYAVMHYFTY